MRIIIALFASVCFFAVEAAASCQQIDRKERELVQWNMKGFQPVIITLKVRTTEHENTKVGLTGSAGFRFWIVANASTRYDKTKLMEEIHRCSFGSDAQQTKLYIKVSGRAQPDRDIGIRTFMTGVVLPKDLVAGRPNVGTTLDLPDGPADFTATWGEMKESGHTVTTLTFVQNDPSK